jgi:hypothetical protein
VFKSKSATAWQYVTVELNGQTLFSGELIDLPIKEEWILAKSVEFFNDYSPCYIHRSAVITRLLDEIWNSLEEYSQVCSDYVDFPYGALIVKR